MDPAGTGGCAARVIARMTSWPFPAGKAALKELEYSSGDAKRDIESLLSVARDYDTRHALPQEKNTARILRCYSQLLSELCLRTGSSEGPGH